MPLNWIVLCFTEYVEVVDGKVTVCRDSVRGKCTRPMCKYYHIPVELPPAKWQWKFLPNIQVMSNLSLLCFNWLYDSCHWIKSWIDLLYILTQVAISLERCYLDNSLLFVSGDTQVNGCHIIFRHIQLLCQCWIKIVFPWCMEIVINIFVQLCHV